jgi:hypothetical protein
MTASALTLTLALALLASDPQAASPQPEGEPLPPGAPTKPYELTAWCYGALGEYLDIYDRVKPDLVAIDKMFGSSVQNEKEPYARDMAAYRKELKVLAGAVQAAEQASPTPIATTGAAAITQGQSIWRPAETKTRRELARAWLSWGMPDKCDSTARELAASSALLGKALTFNNAPAPAAPPAESPPAAPPAESPPAADPAPPPTTPPQSHR